MINIKNLCKEYVNVTPLKNVNCQINKGEVISIIGPSGTGKSTFLRCINKLENPTSGEIIIDGVNILDKKTDIYKVRQKMGMVFQNFNLFSHLMIIENIMLGPVELLKKDKQEAYDEGLELLKMVGLSEKAFNYPEELSGGQKQRVAIARTLAMKPDIVLFDEPTSALDPTMVGEVLSVIRSLAKQGLTMMIVTHEMKFARDVSSRVFYMDEGIIYEEGSPAQIFDNPQKEKTKTFIKRLRVLEKTITNQDFNYISFNSEIEEFSRRQGFSQKKTNAVELIFEELCRIKIIPKLGTDFVLNFKLSYSETDEQCQISISYNGNNINSILNDDNDISTILIKKLTKKITIDNNNIVLVI